MLLISLTALDSEALEVAADGLVVALLSRAENAEELSPGVVTVASVVLSSAVVASVGLASAVVVVMSRAVLSMLASLVVVEAIVEAMVEAVPVEATTEAAVEEAVPSESMGNCSV